MAKFEILCEEELRGELVEVNKETASEILEKLSLYTIYKQHQIVCISP